MTVKPVPISPGTVAVIRRVDWTCRFLAALVQVALNRVAIGVARALIWLEQCRGAYRADVGGYWFRDLALARATFGRHATGMLFRCPWCLVLSAEGDRIERSCCYLAHVADFRRKGIGGDDVSWLSEARGIVGARL